jgi:hypothetical protein
MARADGHRDMQASRPGGQAVCGKPAASAAPLFSSVRLEKIIAALPFTQTIPETGSGCKTQAWLQCNTASTHAVFDLSDN